jgi:hypothetical protein
MPGVFAEYATSVEDPDELEGLVQPEPSSDHALRFRNRVPIGMEGEVALDVDATLVGIVDLGDVVGERLQGRLL